MLKLEPPAKKARLALLRLKCSGDLQYPSRDPTGTINRNPKALQEHVWRVLAVLWKAEAFRHDTLLV